MNEILKYPKLMLAIADCETDTDLDKQLHGFLIYLGILMTAGGLLWGTISIINEFYFAASVPFFYVILTFLNFTYLYFSKNFIFAQNVQIVSSLLLPFFFQFFLGGIVSSGGMILWSAIAVFSSFTLQKKDMTIVWLILFILLMALSGFVDSEAKQFTIAAVEEYRIFFFIINFVLVISIIFSLYYYFSDKEEKVRHELQESLEELHQTQDHLIENNKLLLTQSRQAQMGEMISMIAHQWRQPLSSIASISIDLKIKSELEYFDLPHKEEIQKYEAYVNSRLIKIDDLVQNLTTTIDDFRNFYKPNKAKVTTTLENLVTKALNIVETTFAHKKIKIKLHNNSKEEIKLHDSEMIQVILNIFKNAQDNFKEKQTKNPYIKITTENRTISICDNGGGIPKEVIEKIFDPYFSTKNEKNGTGLGLYMSKTIVEEHHNGKLTVHNTDDGVCFRIKIGELL